MLASRLTQRVTIEEPVKTQAASGEITTAWQTLTADVAAEVLTGIGGEKISAGADQNTIKARINLRYFPATIREMHTYRILWEGGTYNILSVTTDRTARREWRLVVEDGTKYA
jgi:SPP1 family predicted phage head-tail adaptor